MSTHVTSPQRGFVLRSDNDSICLICYRTVKSDRYSTLEEAQREHAQECEPLKGVLSRIPGTAFLMRTRVARLDVRRRGRSGG